MREYAGVKRVAVVGAGTIGASWATYFLSRGLEVSVSDPAPQGEAKVRKFVEDAWPVMSRLGLSDGASIDNLRFDAKLENALESVQFVQENALEKEEFKIDLFEKMGAVTGQDVILASSSSALLVTRYQSRCRFPERCVLGHPFNPPHLIPLVEVVGGEQTAPEATAQAVKFYDAIGKKAILLNKEIAGHVANRLQSALWEEAVRLLADGVAGVEEIDAAIAYGPGIRWALMGPYLTFHLGGGQGGLGYWMDNISRLGSFMSPEVREKMISGVTAETKGRSITQLAQERDERLLELLTMLQKTEHLNPGRD